MIHETYDSFWGRARFSHKDWNNLHAVFFFFIFSHGMHAPSTEDKNWNHYFLWVLLEHVSTSVKHQPTVQLCTVKNDCHSIRIHRQPQRDLSKLLLSYSIHSYLLCKFLYLSNWYNKGFFLYVTTNLVLRYFNNCATFCILSLSVYEMVMSGYSISSDLPFTYLCWLSIFIFSIFYQ